MTEEAREARNAYKRNWRKKHPDKVQDYNRKYWERQAEKAKGEKKERDGT